ncbi:hypothetical protein [Thalassotalea profundi]|uniref:Uncharacterized protein n=1 Tax=Thalassotalea profundi TaxID=2036687 RepID=A0ABQ3J4R4_9GAMM|nr:hypothetical protein [Thalassotalea profundi]GHF02653.1 hypothetical protein GCM10011501_35010 [Thalassotalea profundi]
MDHETLLEDYFLIGIEQSIYASPNLLLAQTGALFSGDLRYRLAISDIQIETSKNQKSYIFLKVKAEVNDISGNDFPTIKTIEAVGSFSQIYHFLVNQFRFFLSQKGLSILLLEDKNDA